MDFNEWWAQFVQGYQADFGRPPTKVNEYCAKAAWDKAYTQAVKDHLNKGDKA